MTISALDAQSQTYAKRNEIHAYVPKVIDVCKCGVQQRKTTCNCFALWLIFGDELKAAAREKFIKATTKKQKKCNQQHGTETDHHVWKLLNRL